ncbi:MAG: glycosyltransferase family 2 protein, partial [Planctomycetota bacterium]
MQSAPRPLSLSACVITKDEERNIGACLDSLAFCDEIVLVDSGSTDRTRELARHQGARVIEADWPGMVAQKNRAVLAARHDWVFCVDADERVSPRLQASIREAFAEEEPVGVAGFRMAWKTVYLGRPVHSDRGGGRWELRLFDRRRGRWVGAEPHGHVEVEGPTKHLEGPLLHHTVRDLAHHVEKMNPYTDAAAAELLVAGKGILFGLIVGPP